MKKSCIILGGGLSGIAASIRLSRYIPGVLLLEQHHRLGGLNSYYRKNGVFFETGLHAVTNYADAKDKHAPLNRLLRQLKLSRSHLDFHQQKESEIHFPRQNCSLRFTNDIESLRNEIDLKFAHCSEKFSKLLLHVERYDPFTPAPYRSARAFLLECLHDRLLTDMLLCPLLYYGSSTENDMDLSQFVIMFRSIFFEGMFRPSGTIQDFIELLQAHLEKLGGEVRLKSGVCRILHDNRKVYGVELANGEQIRCDYLISTAGVSETFKLLGEEDPYTDLPRIGFVESIFHLSSQSLPRQFHEKTVYFYNLQPQMEYAVPKDIVDYNSGVICFPGNFAGRPPLPDIEVRATHLANHAQWEKLGKSREKYSEQKKVTASRSIEIISDLIGDIGGEIASQDTFTPLTINRFTGKHQGAIYGCPTKIKDGNIGFENLFIAGTDQGFLGIIGSMLSGVSMVNQHILPKV